MKAALTFEGLVGAMADTDAHFTTEAVRAVNVSLTHRNWCFGLYIATYELWGAGRAQYGERLVAALSDELQSRGLSNVGRRQLYQYLAFYRAYPDLGRTLPRPALALLSRSVDPTEIVRTAPAQSAFLPGAPVDPTEIVRTAPAQSWLPPEVLVSNLAYSHFEELLKLKDEAQRRFYEAEAVRGRWAVRELRRQMSTLLFERAGLSTDKAALETAVGREAEVLHPAKAIRDPYFFEFLGLKPQQVMGESHLEDALIDKLQAFLLELGRGFCFEARQKRILIGGEHFFIDLVFYHRVLKCHVLVELKVDEFRHEHLGQLNTYVNYFRRHEQTEGDGPPIGLLLCTRKNHALVEYALAGMDNQLFVSRYQLSLPTKEELERVLDAGLRESRGEILEGGGGT